MKNKYTVITIHFFLLFLFWYLLSGKNNLLLIAIGLLSVGSIIGYLSKINLIDEESLPLYLIPKVFTYWFWLYKEILLSSIYVAKLIIAPKLEISPQYFKIKSNQKTSMGFNIYANSITMTPGTISVIINNTKKEINVHSITIDTKDSLKKGNMDKKIKNLMGGSNV
tara:strand:+ start:13943 stop:14443 length:501 start_codon:yes stop_codon:yes gene_type:complete